MRCKLESYKREMWTLKLVLVAKTEMVPKSTAVSVLPHCSSSSRAASHLLPASPVLNFTRPWPYHGTSYVGPCRTDQLQDKMRLTLIGTG